MTDIKKIFSNALPIGVFDSGIGGLTVLNALQTHFPNESYLYMGDTARLPYGTKSPETVIKYAESLTRILLARGVKAIVIACNTASTHALSAVQTMVGDIPVIGMIDPAAKVAIKSTKLGHIGVMGTFGTIKSAAYPRAITALNPDCRISPMSCQMLVAVAEEGWADGDIARAILHKYLDPVFSKKDAPDTLILGCTHFPVFAPLIHEILGDSVNLINSGEAASVTLGQYLDKTAHQIDVSPKFLVTDDPARFADNAVKFYNHRLSIDDIELVDI